jgi:hypothetical protein
MGTRGLIGFKLDGEYRASYNHFDSYPEGLGQEIVDFLLSLNPETRATLVARVRELTWVDGTNTKPSAAEQERYKHLARTDVGNQRLDDWYCLLRNVQGAQCLPLILSGVLKHMSDDTSFAKDSLFCEWAYFINLDDNTLETWRGFQKLPERDNPFGESHGSGPYASEYYPIKMIDSVSLDKLDKDHMSGIEAKVNAEDGDEEIEAPVQEI